MGLTAKATGTGGFDPVPEGVHVAVCFALYDLGTKFDEHWNKLKHEILLMWELPQERMVLEVDGRDKDVPRAISNHYTLSLHKKAILRQHLEAWRGQVFTADELAGFDLRKLLGASCQLQVVHNKSADGSKTYANIAAIMALPKGTPRPKPENPLKFFSFEDNPTELPDDMPEWVQAKVMDSDEWAAITSGAPAGGMADDIPWSDPPPADAATEEPPF